MTHGRTLSREAVRELDRRAIHEYGIPSLLLMENAGRASAEEALALVGPRPRGAVLVLCGPGNNGGDGLVVARTLANRGVAARAVLVGSPDSLERASEDVRTNARLWRGLGEEIAFTESADALRLEDAPLVVDALFGTGLSRPLRPPYDDVVRALDASGRPVLAVDVPSGLDANTGEILGAAVRATTTVTFVAEKPGFHARHGPTLCGHVVVAEIGIPRPWIVKACTEPASAVTLSRRDRGKA